MCLTRPISRNRCLNVTSDIANNCYNYTIEHDVSTNHHFSGFRNVTIDTANLSFINDIWLVKDTTEIITKVSAFLPVVLWGILGNILLLYIILSFRPLRSPTNLLIANMAVADLSSLMIHPWVFLVYDLFQNYQLGEFGCKAEGAIECALLVTSVISLLAISYDRLAAIVLPPETRITKKGGTTLMVIAWISGFVIASPLSFYRTYKERQWKNFLEKYCTEDTAIIYVYWHVIITMLVWLPLIIILICYISMFIKLERYEQVILRRLQPRSVSYKKKVAKMMFIVIVTFMICRLPFTALIFYRIRLMKNNYSATVQNQVNGLYRTLWFIARYLIFVNAAVNPVIYGLTNEQFRRAFKTTALGKSLCSKKAVSLKQTEEEHRKESTMTINKVNIFYIFMKSKTKKQECDTSVVKSESRRGC